MPCFKPLTAWRARNAGPSGKVPVVFGIEGSSGVKVELPCGQCIGCRLERSRQWAVRIMHEASLHEDNCFITLTYNDEHLPSDGSLRKRDFQLFCKRARKKLGPFRFFHCGEYGSLLSRPHYHACMFGLDFFDKKLYTERDGVKLYESPTLSDLWGQGFATVGALTFESAAYVARYVLKKVTGDAAEEHYSRVDMATGAIVDLQPEYVTMSRRPGIGRDWFEQWGNEVYPSDEVIARGVPCKPPRYYDSLLEAVDPSLMERVKARRVATAELRSEHATPSRLAVREKIAKARTKMLRRSLEE